MNATEAGAPRRKIAWKRPGGNKQRLAVWWKLRAASPALLLLSAGVALAAIRQVQGRPVYFAGEKPFFVHSATFAYQQYPKDLWPDLLVNLKNMGFNTIQLPVPQPQDENANRNLPQVLRLARQLGFRIWFSGGGSAADSESTAAVGGVSVLGGLDAGSLRWFPAAGNAPPSKRLLTLTDVIAVRHLLPRPPRMPVVAAFDAGWSSSGDVQARPSDSSNYLLATRELLADGVKALNCSAVLEELSAGREAAVSLAGESRPQASVFRRNGALLSSFGPLLAAMHPAGDVPLRPVPRGGERSFPLLRLAMLASDARGPALISALNFSETRPVDSDIQTADPRTGRPLVLRGLNLPPRQALLMPVNFPLPHPEICGDCSSFAPDERLVWATAELLSVSFENGVLAMEFAAPAEGELTLELAREPKGPLITGGHIRPFDWDEKTHRLHVRIPAGPAPEYRTRVGLAIDLPDSSVFLKTARRLVIGSTAKVTAVFSPPALARRSRLLAPPGWRIKADPPGKDALPGEIDYSVDVPAGAVAGDTVTLAVEADGKIVQTTTLTLAPFCTVRIEPEETLHLRPDERFAIRPYLAALHLPGQRAYRVLLRNNYDEIRNFEITASGEGLVFSPSHLEVSVGGGLERQITFYAVPAGGSGQNPGADDFPGRGNSGSERSRTGLYRGNLEIRQGSQKSNVPLALAVIAPGESLAYEFDMDRDGSPELVLENRKLRAVFFPRQGGRSTEFLLKDEGINAFSIRGALDAGFPMEGRVLGPGRIELHGGGLTRIISLGGDDSYFDVEETGSSGDWLVSAAPDLAWAGPKGHARFAIDVPNARIEADRRPFSINYRVQFADIPSPGSRSARFLFEWIEEHASQPGK
jgi:hypothetical protein